MDGKEGNGAKAEKESYRKDLKLTRKTPEI